MIQYYNVVEVLYREAFKDEISSQIQADFEAKLVDLYCLILEYQAQTIRQLSTNILIKSYGKTKSSWVRILDSIKESDILCKQRLDLLDRNRLRQTLETQESRINEQYSELFQRLINLQESGNETLRILRGKPDWETTSLGKNLRMDRPD